MFYLALTIIVFQHCCCGVTNWQDYRIIFHNNTVVRSCCNFKIVSTDAACDVYRMNVTAKIVANGYIFDEVWKNNDSIVEMIYSYTRLLFSCCP